MTNWFEVEFVLLKHLKLQPDVLDKMEFYRVEFLMENFKNDSENEGKRNKEQEDEQKEKYNPNSMMKNQQNMMKQYTGGNNNLSSLAGGMPKF